jgi:CheY-like chemotaxis protein
MLSLSQFRNSGSIGLEAFPARFDRDDVNPRDKAKERALVHRQARILSIGDDSVLLYSRRLVLETAGYAVESARGILPHIEQILQRRFDLILLCHSVGEEVIDRIVEVSSRIAPQTPLLQITPLDNPFRNQAHPPLVSADPAGLLNAIAGQLASPPPRCNGNRSRLAS